jgi:hypothetical protein
MAERGNASGELLGRGRRMARAHQGVYICRSWSEQREICSRMQEKDQIQDTGELWTAALIEFL